MIKINTKSLLFLVFLKVTILGIILTNGCAKKEGSKTSTAQFLTFTDSANEIKIKYPSGWTKNKDLKGIIITFDSPKENASDKVQENLNVIKDELPAQTTLDQYIDLSTNQAKQSIEDFKLTNSSKITLAGNPARKLTFTGKSNKHNLKWLQIVAEKNNKIYALTYTANILSSWETYRI
jgi:serine/threonine-protein kinase